MKSWRLASTSLLAISFLAFNSVPAFAEKLYQPNGTNWLGPVLDGEPQGFGRLEIWRGDEPKPRIWMGEIEDWKPYGFGKLTYWDDSFAVGVYVNGLKNGFGATVNKGKDITTIGFWKDDQLQRGRTYWKDFRGSYVGRMGKKGAANGFGRAVHPDGRREQGDFTNSVLNGFGKYTLPSGGDYVGFLRNGRREGKGIYVHANGRRVSGVWKNDKLYEYAEVDFSSEEARFREEDRKLEIMLEDLNSTLETEFSSFEEKLNNWKGRYEK